MATEDDSSLSSPPLVWVTQGEKQNEAYLLETDVEKCKIRWKSTNETEQVPRWSVFCPVTSQARKRKVVPSSLQQDSRLAKKKSCGDETAVSPPTSVSPQQRCKEQGRRASLLGYSFEECSSEPAVKFVKGSAQKREQGKQWLQETREMLESLELNSRKRSRKQELYVGHNSNGMLPAPHSYRNEVFCDKALLPTSCQHIKVLTDAEFKKSLSDVFDYKDHLFLHKTAMDASEAIADMAEFQGAAIRSMPDKERNAWYEKLESMEDVENVMELLEAAVDAVDLKDPFKYSFRAATFHDQTADSATRMSTYHWHKDKVGNIVCFCPLSGISYNFVAMQSNGAPRKKGSEKEQAKLETSNDYQAYKNSLPAQSTNRKMIETFEAKFLQEATALGLPRVRVYELQAADKLIFTASDYLHATIIPKQEDGIRRSLLVFHDLVPYETKDFVY